MTTTTSSDGSNFLRELSGIHKKFLETNEIVFLQKKRDKEIEAIKDRQEQESRAQKMLSANSEKSNAIRAHEEQKKAKSAARNALYTQLAITAAGTIIGNPAIGSALGNVAGQVMSSLPNNLAGSAAKGLFNQGAELMKDFGSVGRSMGRQMIFDAVTGGRASQFLHPLEYSRPAQIQAKILGDSNTQKRSEEFEDFVKRERLKHELEKLNGSKESNKLLEEVRLLGVLNKDPETQDLLIKMGKLKDPEEHRLKLRQADASIRASEASIAKSRQGIQKKVPKISATDFLKLHGQVEHFHTVDGLLKKQVDALNGPEGDAVINMYKSYRTTTNNNPIGLSGVESILRAFAKIGKNKKEINAFNQFLSTQSQLEAIGADALMGAMPSIPKVQEVYKDLKHAWSIPIPDDISKESMIRNYNEKSHMVLSASDRIKATISQFSLSGSSSEGKDDE